MKRGFELSVAVAAQVLQMSGGEGFIFNPLLGKTMHETIRIFLSGSGEKKHRLSRNLRCGHYDRVPTGCSLHAMGCRGVFRFPVPERPREWR